MEESPGELDRMLQQGQRDMPIDTMHLKRDPAQFGWLSAHLTKMTSNAQSFAPVFKWLIHKGSLIQWLPKLSQPKHTKAALVGLQI